MLYRIIRGEIVAVDTGAYFPTHSRELDTHMSGDHEYMVYDTPNCEPTELWVGVVGQNVLPRESQAIALSLYGEYVPEYAITVEGAYALILQRQRLAAEFS